MQDGLQYVARRNNTFALQVHVGVRGADRAIQVCDRLRPVLPMLLAISANSPFVDGRDSGLHSARTQTFTKSFPRCGVPDVFGSWRSWQDYVALLLRTNSIVEFTQLWWSVRAHHSFGTIEVRVCDAQTTGTEADALVELIVACVAQALREVDAGETPPDLPGRLIEENMWRAIRYGQDGRLLDLEAPTIEEYPAAEALDRLKAWTGVDVALPELNGAQRQRRMIDAGASPYEVFKQCVEETRATYPAQEKVRDEQPAREFSEEEMRAIEAEMEKLTVDDVLLQTLVTLINLGARKAGLAAPPGEDGPKRDLEQTRQAIDGARALLPLLEARHGEELGAGQGRAVAAPDGVRAAFRRNAAGRRAGPEQPDGPGPAQRSGRLWVPGQ